MIAAIGAFDGFHIGHQALLGRARVRAETLGGSWGTVTFSKHPDSLFYGPKFKYLFTAKEQRCLEKYFSVPVSCRIDFTRRVADMAPGEFLDFISEKFGVTGIAVGEDFRFGKNRAGDCGVLRSECRRRGWDCSILDAMRLCGGAPLSSTAVREAVSAGDMTRVRSMLGYPFFCVSRVIHGNERGRGLGRPTANLEVSEEKAALRHGVYATLVRACGKWYAGAANAGINPTFSDVSGTRFEINLIGFEGDLYGRDIAAFIIERVRDERKFGGAADLRRQIDMDAAIVKQAGEKELASRGGFWEKWAAVLQM
ncbi:MAG: riboflavin biosynthesis protein RibF [Synergistaceae bacterium]|jgi:riboflavin kinase/FMN adenylyltransferase|nr:riboflavin biosynthesis protein RibF [Synergistaceae bacterium]